MTRTYRSTAGILSVVGLMVAFLFGSCSFGLEPASSAGKASLTIRFGSAASTSRYGADRALATRSGFLYVQTGSEPATAVLYGPYEVGSDGEVTVTDIPAGTYTTVLLAFVPTLPENALALIYPPDESPESFRLSVQSRLSDVDLKRSSSCAVVKQFTLREGRKNYLSATFVPTTDLVYNNESYPLMGSATDVSRQFVRLNGIASQFTGAGPNDLKMMRFALATSVPETVFVSSFALCDSSGKYIYRDASTHTFNNSNPFTAEIPWSGDDVYYAFVEYSAEEVVFNAQCVITVVTDNVPPIAENLYIFDLDETAPNRYTYTNSENVTLMLTYTETGSGITRILLNGLQSLPSVDGVPSFEVVCNGVTQVISSFTGNSIDLATPVIETTKTMLILGISLPAGDGLKDVSVTLTDAAGNESDAAFGNTTLDTIPPVITLSLGANTDCSGSIESSSVYFRTGGVLTYELSDTMSGIQGDITCAGSATFVNPSIMLLSGGNIILTARDGADNIRTTTVSTVFDPDGPTVSGLSTTLNSLIFTGYFTGSGISRYSLYQTATISSTSISDPTSLSYATFSMDTPYSGGALTINGLNPLNTHGYLYVKLCLYDKLGNQTTYFIERFYNSSSTEFTCTIR